MKGVTLGQGFSGWVGHQQAEMGSGRAFQAETTARRWDHVSVFAK